jgi:hypothetical protein
MDNDKKLIAYTLHRYGKATRWIESGRAHPRNGGGFDIFLQSTPIGGFNGHILVRPAGLPLPPPAEVPLPAPRRPGPDEDQADEEQDP